MAAYVIVNLTVKNPEKMSEYSKKAIETLGKYGGEFVAKGKIHPLYGDALFENGALIKFPNLDEAIAWYESKDYQALISLRSQGMDCKFQLVDGI